ncbi:hypothetical protein TU84_10930 [Pseudomonas helleri]|nr:hypothetical protein TU84_10930 [Pseudomonas helleri]
MLNNPAVNIMFLLARVIPIFNITRRPIGYAMFPNKYAENKTIRILPDSEKSFGKISDTILSEKNKRNINVIVVIVILKASVFFMSFFEVSVESLKEADTRGYITFVSCEDGMFNAVLILSAAL